MDKTERTVLEGVCGGSSIVVSFYAGGEVLSGADVETAVSTRKDVDVVHLNTIRLESSVIDAFMARHERAQWAGRMGEPIGIERTAFRVRLFPAFPGLPNSGRNIQRF